MKIAGTPSRAARARGDEHRLGDVDADALAGSGEPPRDGDGRRAGAAADVEHAARRIGEDRVDEQVLERLVHPVDRVLRVDPRAARRAVPQSWLIVRHASSFGSRRDASAPRAPGRGSRLMDCDCLI
jgi:hypothetical protein